MKRIRPSIFETNSSSSHTLVFSHNRYHSIDIATKQSEPYYFPVQFYEFGTRTKSIYMDVSRKFSFFFQAFLNGLTLNKEGEELYDEVRDKDDQGFERYNHVKSKDYMKNRAKILVRYGRIMELLQIAGEKIREDWNIRLDFSDMKLSLTAEVYPIITSKETPLCGPPMLSNAGMEKMEMKELFSEMERMVSLPKKEYDREKMSFEELKRFLIECLNFAFSSKCIIFEGDDSYSVDTDYEYEETMSRILDKNDRAVDIISS